MLGPFRDAPAHYTLPYACSLCGSCVEACRDGAIRFSRDYNLAGLNKEDFVMDLFKRLQNEAARDGMDYEIDKLKPPVPAAPATAPAGAPAAKPAGTPTPAAVPPVNATVLSQNAPEQKNQPATPQPAAVETK